MKYIKSIKSKIIPCGLYVGELCVLIDFHNELEKIPVSLSSGVVSYYDNIDANTLLDIFENYENETIVFNGGNIDLLKKSIPTLSKKNNIILICENTNYYNEILKFVDLVELRVFGKCFENFKDNLIQQDFYVNLFFDKFFDVEDLIEFCEIISEFNPNVDLILTPYSSNLEDLPNENTLISLCQYGNEYVHTKVIKFN